MNKTQTLITSIGAWLLMLPLSYAGNVTIPNSFTSGTAAVAAEVNANFNAVENEIDDNDSRVTDHEIRITALESLVTTLQTQLSTANNTIATLQTQLSDVQNNSVLALDGYLMFDTDTSGYERALFSGVNIQIVNGQHLNNGGNTEEAQTHTNGLGNLIVGYNNLPSVQIIETCSLGAFDNQTDCENAGWIWGMAHRMGSHNLVAGDYQSYSRYGGVVFGHSNVTNRRYSSALGGLYSVASGDYSSVSGGFNNTASGLRASVSGGSNNTATGGSSSVSGGYNNNAGDFANSISGGAANITSNTYSSISGGQGNTASGSRSSICGGYNNTASGNYSSITAGFRNSATGYLSSISGGGDGTQAGGNTANHDYSSILGGVGQITTSSSQTIPALP